jgi:hypothetical protein
VCVVEFFRLADILCLNCSQAKNKLCSTTEAEENDKQEIQQLFEGRKKDLYVQRKKDMQKGSSSALSSHTSRFGVLYIKLRLFTSQHPPPFLCCSTSETVVEVDECCGGLSHDLHPARAIQRCAAPLWIFSRVHVVHHR